MLFHMGRKDEGKKELETSVRIDNERRAERQKQVETGTVPSPELLQDAAVIHLRVKTAFLPYANRNLANPAGGKIYETRSENPGDYRRRFDRDRRSHSLLHRREHVSARSWNRN